jgi:hypothetical protein
MLRVASSLLHSAANAGVSADADAAVLSACTRAALLSLKSKHAEQSFAQWKLAVADQGAAVTFDPYLSVNFEVRRLAAV